MRALYRLLWLTRALEERLEIIFKQGHVVGGLYRSLGQEATAVGCGYALTVADWVAPSIRDLGALLARGLDPREVIRQYTARGSSLCAGKDNTNHFTVPDLGILGPISPLGTQLCVLNGVALSFRMRGEPRVCLTFQGDGASRTGTSHEGLAMAAALDLPIVVVLEHNRWAFGTPSTEVAAIEDWADVAGAYGVPAVTVDGNDVLQVYDAATQALARARAGDGMTLLVAETYRMLGHAQHDAQKYVPEAELAEWQDHDPIRSFEDYLVEFGFESQASLEEIRSGIDGELDLAAEEVLAEGYPPGEEARTRVYGDSRLDASVPWTRGPVPGYEDLVAGPGRATTPVREGTR
jgi:pyruvate dehydrogenase E1 component alpha subunit/2-oxoisovalerate dehydrogenase E1 component alpha subunit